MNSIKISLVAVITAALILVAAPTIASASIDGTTDSCDSNPLYTKCSIPTCCLTADCLLTDCVLSNTTDDKVLYTCRFLPNKNVYIALHKMSVSTETSPNPKKPLQWELFQKLLPHPSTGYHCRNCLDTEEPYRV